MTRHNRSNSASLRFAARAALASLVLLCGTTLIHAQALTYVDAVSYDYGYPPANIYTSAGAQMSLPSHGLDPFQSVEADNLWGWRSFGVPTLGYSTIYESNNEDCPEVQVRMTGLSASTNYDVYVVYWSDRASNWNIRAGLASNPGANQLFDRDGDEGNGATAGTLGSSAAWTVPPANNIDPETDDDPSPFVDHTPGAEQQFTRDMFLGLVGTQMSTAGGQINVYLDDLPGAGLNERSWMEGLAYVPAGTTIFTTATLDRDTGSLSINNPTPVAFDIARIELVSDSGSLNGTVWNTVADGDSGVPTDTDGDWQFVAYDPEAEGGAGGWVSAGAPSVSETSLAEQDEGFFPIPSTDPQSGAQNGVTFDTAGAGQTWDFGNVWRRTPYEDVEVRLTSTAGNVLVIAPAYTGTEITPGDFDADGVIDADDYIALIGGLHVDFLTDALAYAEGDIDGDGDVDRSDVVIFRGAYEAANGAGSFAGMLAGLAVPEPSTAVLSALACGGLVVMARRRQRPNRAGTRRSRNMMCLHQSTPWLIVLAAGLVAGGLLTGTAAAVPVVDWQFDPTVGTGTGVLTDPETNSPTIGDGSAQSADQKCIYGSTPAPVSLLNGQEVVLSGQVTFTGATVGAGNGSFRWGLFKDTDPGDDTPTTEWLGYLAQSAGGNPADGQFYAKNPDATDWETVSFISSWTPEADGAPYSGPYTGGQSRVFLLARGAGVTATDFGNDEDTYEFQITIGRYGEEVTVSATMVSLDAGPSVGDYNENGVVDAADYTVWRDNLGQSITLPNEDPNATTPGVVDEEDYDFWKANFGATGSGPTYNYALGGGIDYNGNPPPAPPELGGNTEPPYYTDHVTFEFDRVGFLFADHFNADQASMANIEISTGNIQSVTVEVDTSTGAARILNESSEDFDMIYYEITSESESLIPGNWTSLDDAEGGDPVGVEWDEAGGSDAGVLSEVNLLGTPFDLSASGSTTLWSLGNVWNTGGEQDLRFFFTTSNNALIRGIVTYVGAGAGALAAVPEPGTAWLLWVGVVSALAYRRSSRRPDVR